MATPTFKIRCNLVGHKSDVRCLTTISGKVEAIVSGSRDVSSKLWKSEKNSVEFVEALMYGGHGGFVSSLCYVKPSDSFPSGLIYSGSNDSTINAYTLESPQPVFTLKGHESNVCALACTESGLLFSGSWDTTGKVWNQRNCTATLKGHQAAIWAVLIVESSQILITASADKTICLWNYEGHKLQSLTGHTDCVRGLALLSQTTFVSCANDASIRLWSLEGRCLREFHGHSNFVYNVVSLPGGMEFASCGEDRSLRVWNIESADCVQTITHPTQSVWCVCSLDNGDLVTGASDGIVRVFSRNSLLQGPPDVQRALEEEVAASSIPSQIGDIQKDKLPGPEALSTPGTKEGQVLMVREDDTVICYQWSNSDQRWIKVGDVVGSSGSSQPSIGKMLFEGVEYDYVFSVDMEEGKPPLKLPYNLSEDPWMSAQTFIHKHNLSQLFLDQIANFIIEQLPSGRQQEQQPAGGSDPLTGGGRYVPPSGPSASTPSVGQRQRYQPPAGVDCSDPLTGGGRYVPGSEITQTAPVNNGSSQSNKFFPKRDYLEFDGVKWGPLVDKLKSLNANSANPISDSTFAMINDLKNPGKSVSVQLYQRIIETLRSWPEDKVFPLLDMLRYVVRDEASNKAFFAQESQLDTVLSLADNANKSANNRSLTLKLLTNAFLGTTGRKTVTSRAENLMDLVRNMGVSNPKSVQVPACSFILNLSVLITSTPVGMASNCHEECLRCIVDLLSTSLESEAIFRLLVAAGTLVTLKQKAIDSGLMAALRERVVACSDKDDSSKVMECSVFLLQVL